MAEGDWVRPAIAAETTENASGRGEKPVFELRPLSLGEILDRTFSLYRSRFWLFAGSSSVAAAVNTIGQAISLTTAGKLARHMVIPPPGGRPALNFHEFGWAEATSWLMTLLFFLVTAVTQAAIAYALSEVYLRRSVNVESALRAVGPRWTRWIGIAVWQACSAAWLPILFIAPAVFLLARGAHIHGSGLAVSGGILLTLGVLGATPVGLVLYLRNALAIPAAVTEGLGIRAAMARSKVLAVGTKGRMFVVLLIAGCLYEVVGVLQSPAAVLIVLAPNKQHYIARAIALAVAFIGHAVVGPVALIGLALVYFDQRVRREALDLELLLENTRSGSSALPPVNPAPLSPEGYAPLG